MENIKLLIEDYKRRLKTITTEIQKGGNDLTINRLSTKGSCYRTFIAELERALAETSNDASAFPIPDVSSAACRYCGKSNFITINGHKMCNTEGCEAAS